MTPMKTFTALILVGIGAVVIWPGAHSSPVDGSPLPPPVILASDSPDVAAIKMAAIYLDGLAKESESFAPRLTAREFSGPAPAASAWQAVSQEQLHAAGLGISRQLQAIQELPDGWEKSAAYQVEAAKGWRAASQELTRLAAKGGGR